MAETNPFDAIRELEFDGDAYRMADLTALEEEGLCELDPLPVSIRVLLESVLRNVDGDTFTAEDIRKSLPGNLTFRMSNSRSSRRGSSTLASATGKGGSSRIRSSGRTVTRR